MELRSILKRGGNAKASAYLKQVALDAERDHEAQEQNRVTRLASKISRSISSKSMHDHATDGGAGAPSSLSRDHTKLLQKMREQKKKCGAKTT